MRARLERPVLVLGFLVAGLSAGLPALGRVDLPWWSLCYPAESLLASAAYALDRRAARRGRPRWSETGLHLLALLGGWPGALAAQRLLRHKTRKRSFQLVFWAIGLLHVALWGILTTQR